MSRIARHCTMLVWGLMLAGGCSGQPSAPPLPADLSNDSSGYLSGDMSAEPLQGIEVIELPEFTNSIGMKFKLIPAGKFVVGEARGTQREVQITEPFYLGVTEVTQEQYENVIGTNPSSFIFRGRSNLGSKQVNAGKAVQIDSSSFPVELVSWYDAVDFCKKLSAMDGRRYRLPTEAEWEYACRAGTSTSWCFGDDAARLTEYAWYLLNSEGRTQQVNGKKRRDIGRTHRVASKKPNAWGLYDMHGNVWEWCGDKVGDGSLPVARGGCWLVDANDCRSASRFRALPDSRIFYLGFRVAADPPSDRADEEQEG